MLPADVTVGSVSHCRVFRFNFWNQPPEAFNLVCGFALKWCADFGMLCTKIILTDFGFDAALEGLKQEWENIKRQRDFVYAQELYKFHCL